MAARKMSLKPPQMESASKKLPLTTRGNGLNEVIGARQRRIIAPLIRACKRPESANHEPFLPTRALRFHLLTRFASQ
jgi:hypothetical protein